MRAGVVVGLWAVSWYLRHMYQVLFCSKMSGRGIPCEKPTLPALEEARQKLLQIIDSDGDLLPHLDTTKVFQLQQMILFDRRWEGCFRPSWVGDEFAVRPDLAVARTMILNYVGH